MSSLIDSIRAFILTCPFLQDWRVNVDYIGEEMGYSIDPLPCDPIIQKYMDGGATKQFQFAFTSQEEYDLAINTELAFQLNGTTNFEGDPLQSVIDYVRDYCDEELGIDIYQGNMVIYTTFDLETQQLYEAIMNGEYGYFEEDYPLCRSRQCKGLCLFC